MKSGARRNASVFCVHRVEAACAERGTPQTRLESPLQLQIAIDQLPTTVEHLVTHMKKARGIPAGEM